MKIAVLGATGHLAKCAVSVYSKDDVNVFYLFSRSLNVLEDMYGNRSNFFIKRYVDFPDHDYDVIFNGVGVWDTPGRNVRDVFSVTEHFDNMILDYQKKHPCSMSIHISSGAAYANDFDRPVVNGTRTTIDINNFTLGDYYSVAKINSEVKHRAFEGLNIVDLRLFGFFSRYMNLGYPYLLSAMINAVKENKRFNTVSVDFWRDYIHMDDFAGLLKGISMHGAINMAIDVRSKAPISKSQLIQFFVESYGLQVNENDAGVEISSTGMKPCYYSKEENPIYAPSYTSLDTVKKEIKYFL